MTTSDPSFEATLDYLKEAYASNRDWYARAETKAQLLLGANGLFISVLFGSIFTRTVDLHAVTRSFGPETWVFLSISLLSIIVAVGCAALTMWSRHGQSTDEELAWIAANAPADPDYPLGCRPEALWYFGHLARFDRKVAIEGLEKFKPEHALRVYRHNLVTLSERVFYKYKYLNLGWTFTAIAFIMIAASGGSIVLRS